MNATLPEFEKQIKKNVFSENQINNICYDEINYSYIYFLYIIIVFLIISLFYEFYKIYSENRTSGDSLKVVQIA